MIKGEKQIKSVKKSKMLYWHIYEVSNKTRKLTGVKFRGILRKFSLINNIILLTENALDDDNIVRFAILADQELKSIDRLVVFINKIAPNGFY